MAHIRLKNYGGVSYPDILYIVQGNVFVNGFKYTNIIKYANVSYGGASSSFYNLGYSADINKEGGSASCGASIIDINSDDYTKLKKYNKLHIAIYCYLSKTWGRDQPFSASVNGVSVPTIYPTGTSSWSGTMVGNININLESSPLITVNLAHSWSYANNRVNPIRQYITEMYLYN